MNIRQLHGDYTSVTDLVAANPREYDNILLLGRDWMTEGEEADARTLFGNILLRDVVPGTGDKPWQLMELMDPDNDRLFTKQTGEVIITPVILSHILAHVALLPDLDTVFDELFTCGGAELLF